MQVVGHHVSVEEGLVLMKEAVKRGSLEEAQVIGTRSDRPLSLSSNDVKMGSLLSTGAESRVYQGTYNAIPVAIKKPIIRTTADLDRFREELKIMAKLQHPSIISLLGGRLLPPDYYLVMPLENGSYYDAIHNEGHRLYWKQIIEIGHQLSGAMQHLHENGFLHRDLKTRNILRGTDKRVKLIDFGIARSMKQKSAIAATRPTGGFHKQQIIGTLEYMAPEVLQHKGHSAASDVYAFAITLNEIATGIYPFSDCNKENPDAHTVLEMGYGRQELATAVATEGLRPTLCSQYPSVLSQLLQSCWQLDQFQRPSFATIHEQFTNILYSFNTLKLPKQIMTKHRNSSLSKTTLSKPPQEDNTELTMLNENAWLKNIVEKSCYSADVTCGVFATAGFRGEDRMEDRHLINTGFLDISSAVFLGVFDGHRGPETAEFARNCFHDVLSKNIQTSVSAEHALTKSFLEVEEQFEASSMAKIEEPRGVRFPGCTALTALIVKDRIYISNAGDCRAVLCRDGQAYQLSRDHTAMDSLERFRIEKYGKAAILWRKGSWRVGDAGIQVTRSLGDVDLKHCGVCAEPEITTFDLTASDSFLVIASDGLWDTVTNEEAIRLVLDTVKQPDMCAKRLATEALTRGSQDNITVIVAFLKPVPTLEQIYSNGRLKYSTHSRALKCRMPRMAADEMFEVL